MKLKQKTTVALLSACLILSSSCGIDEDESALSTEETNRTIIVPESGQNKARGKDFVGLGFSNSQVILGESKFHSVDYQFRSPCLVYQTSEIGVRTGSKSKTSMAMAESEKWHDEMSSSSLDAGVSVQLKDLKYAGIDLGNIASGESGNKYSSSSFEQKAGSALSIDFSIKGSFVSGGAGAFQNAIPRLRQEVADIINNTPEHLKALRFWELCGTNYIRQIATGGYIESSVSLVFNTVEDKQRFFSKYNLGPSGSVNIGALVQLLSNGTIPLEGKVDLSIGVNTQKEIVQNKGEIKFKLEIETKSEGILGLFNQQKNVFTPERLPLNLSTHPDFKNPNVLRPTFPRLNDGLKPQAGMNGFGGIHFVRSNDNSKPASNENGSAASSSQPSNSSLIPNDGAASAAIDVNAAKKLVDSMRAAANGKKYQADLPKYFALLANFEAMVNTADPTTRRELDDNSVPVGIVLGNYHTDLIKVPSNFQIPSLQNLLRQREYLYTGINRTFDRPLRDSHSLSISHLYYNRIDELVRYILTNRGNSSQGTKLTYDNRTDFNAISKDLRMRMTALGLITECLRDLSSNVNDCRRVEIIDEQDMKHVFQIDELRDIDNHFDKIRNKLPQLAVELTVQNTFDFYQKFQDVVFGGRGGFERGACKVQRNRTSGDLELHAYDDGNIFTIGETCTFTLFRTRLNSGWKADMRWSRPYNTQDYQVHYMNSGSTNISTSVTFWSKSWTEGVSGHLNLDSVRLSGTISFDRSMLLPQRTGLEYASLRDLQVLEQDFILSQAIPRIVN